MLNCWGGARGARIITYTCVPSFDAVAEVAEKLSHDGQGQGKGRVILLIFFEKKFTKNGKKR